VSQRSRCTRGGGGTHCNVLGTAVAESRGLPVSRTTNLTDTLPSTQVKKSYGLLRESRTSGAERFNCDDVVGYGILLSDKWLESFRGNLLHPPSGSLLKMETITSFETL
jgi:hypothetical protein